MCGSDGPVRRRLYVARITQCHGSMDAHPHLSFGSDRIGSSSMLRPGRQAAQCGLAWIIVHQSGRVVPFKPLHACSPPGVPTHWMVQSLPYHASSAMHIFGLLPINLGNLSFFTYNI